MHFSMYCRLIINVPQKPDHQADNIYQNPAQIQGCAINVNSSLNTWPRTTESRTCSDIQTANRKKQEKRCFWQHLLTKFIHFTKNDRKAYEGLNKIQPVRSVLRRVFSSIFSSVFNATSSVCLGQCSALCSGGF